MRKKKFVIGGLVLFIAIGYLAYTGFMGSATFYYTVGEFMKQTSASNGENVRVGGVVTPGSVEQQLGAEGTTLRFTVADAEQKVSLPVAYKGVVPDTFKAGNEVVVEGHLNSAGIFEAHTIMPKCASKYVSQG